MSETIATSRIDEEDIRLTTGFADIFTAILLVFGGSLLVGLMEEAGGLVIAALAFVLAKPLVEQRGFAASGNVLAAGVAIGIAVLLGELEAFALVPVAAACFGFWWIRRVPLAMALAIASAVFFIVTLALGPLDAGRFWSRTGAGLPAFVAGLAIFGAGIRFDAKDRMRRTRQSDIAFWLHLGSAPLIVHGFLALAGANPLVGTDVAPGIVLGTFAVLTIVSLAIDRRPLLASSFIYLVAATATLIRDSHDQPGFGAAELHAATAPAIIGIVILALAAGWARLREWVVTPLPADLREWLPPLTERTPPAPERREDLPEAETEPVRLVMGFNDFFVAIGVAGLFVGSFVMGLLAAWQMGGFIADRDSIAEVVSLAWIVLAAPAGSMWLVAEYFVRQRRMAWPAIVSALAFALVLGLAALLAATHLLVVTDHLGRGSTSPGAGLATACVLLASTVGFAGNLAFWARHRLPTRFALAVLALLPLAFIDGLSASLMQDTDPFEWEGWRWRVLAFGAGVFALAMLWDRRDPDRRTQRADIAFWLHLLAAMLIVPTAAGAMLGIDGGGWVILGGFVAILLAAVVIDRRAPVAISLPFVIAAFATIMPDGSAIVASLALVGALLWLAYNWEMVRGALLGARLEAA